MGSKSGYIEQLVLGFFALECLSAKNAYLTLPGPEGLQVNRQLLFTCRYPGQANSN